MALAPRERQTLLFSATMTEDVEQLVHASLRRPLRLAADTADQAPPTLTQEIVRLKVLHIEQAACALVLLSVHRCWRRLTKAADLERSWC